MILGGDPEAVAPSSAGGRAVTIDAIFRHAARRRPDALALADAANRPDFTDGGARRLTYAEADAAVAAIAGRLLAMGLPADSVIAVQLPNIVEYPLTLLGIWRAGMIAAPLPLLWRRVDAVTALARVGAKALITCARAGRFNHAQLALRVASEVFSIRYVCGFGDKLPDGVVSFDDLLGARPSVSRAASATEPQDNAVAHSAAHLALISFDLGESGIVAVARSHVETLAGGLAVWLESGLAPESVMLSTLALSSFAGIGLTVLPWLLGGGTLVLHQPFDTATLDTHIRDAQEAMIVMPGAVALRLSAAGALGSDGVRSVIAAWRAPEIVPNSLPWRGAAASLIDVLIFGEAGLIAGRRAADGAAAPLLFGRVTAPRGGADGLPIAELTRTAAGTLAIRGAMVPHQVYPPGIERSGLAYFKIGDGGFVDTGYPCRLDPARGELTISGAPAGIVSIGGYRFPRNQLQEVVSRIDSGATLAAVPDALLGQRLVGNAALRDVIEAALNAVGVNPIVASAFRDGAEQIIAERA